METQQSVSSRILELHVSLSATHSALGSAREVPDTLSRFNQNWTFSTDFNKSPIQSFMKESPVGVELIHANGHDEANSGCSPLCELTEHN
jgi:hypothetical protein